MNIVATPTPAFVVQKSDERFSASHGWLHAKHSFSFADYYDPANMGWGALRVFNEDRIEADQGFPPHPHRDMEIITYVFSGQLEHKDSMGNHGVVRDGGVQFMSAGTGVRHSEVNASKTEPLHLVQMWVIPGKLGVKPDYGQIDFTAEERLKKWLVVASGQSSVQAPITLTQNATLRVSRLEETTLRHVFEPKRYGFLFVGDGEIDVHGETTKTVRLKKGDALRIYDIPKIELHGTGEVVFWDVPPVREDAL